MASPPSPSSPTKTFEFRSSAAPFVPSYSLPPSSLSAASLSLAAQLPSHSSRHSNSSSNSTNPHPPAPASPSSPSFTPKSARQSNLSHRATAELPGQHRSGASGAARGQVEADGRVGGGSGKKGRERGEVLTNLVEFQFAKKEEPVYAVRRRAVELWQWHL
jgi:hypothetical protein